MPEPSAAGSASSSRKTFGIASLVVAVAATGALAQAPAIASGGAKPGDLHAVVRQSIRQMQDAGRKLSEYGFTSRHERREFNSSGQITSRSVWVNKRELIDGFMFVRTVERDGQPVAAPERAKIEEAIRERLAEMKALTPEQLAQRREEARKRSSAESAWLQEIPEALDFRLVGEESIHDRPALVMECSPRAGYRAKNVRARVFEKTRGRLWIDKAESELVKGDVEVFDTVSVGWGVLGRIEKGTRFFIQRRKVAPQTWLLEGQTIKFAARMMLFKTVHSEMITRFSDFRHQSEMMPGIGSQ